MLSSSCPILDTTCIPDCVSGDNVGCGSVGGPDTCVFPGDCNGDVEANTISPSPEECSEVRDKKWIYIV